MIAVAFVLLYVVVVVFSLTLPSMGKKESKAGGSVGTQFVFPLVVVVFVFELLAVVGFKLLYVAVTLKSSEALDAPMIGSTVRCFQKCCQHCWHWLVRR